MRNVNSAVVITQSRHHVGLVIRDNRREADIGSYRPYSFSNVAVVQRLWTSKGAAQHFVQTEHRHE